MHFYGPTSSLHLTEQWSSSLLQWGPISAGNEQGLQDVAPELQSYLLNLYWTYQHNVLQVVHKEAFLRDMETSQTRYFSKLLLYCIYACAARISKRPDIRALALPTDEDVDDEQPYFIKKATKLLVLELKRPRITTIQS
jgi:Fungal specific transcription factor domain